MKTDIEIAREAKMLPIMEIAARLGLPEESVIPYGRHKAKINYESVREYTPKAKVILVTAINPTPAGEGKTTTTVGLGDAMARRGKKTVICLREPSLGPVFGVKGGAAGGGCAQVVPMEDINLHFTGDLHAVTAANNLLAAMIDNHIYQGNRLNIDPRRVVWRRAMDMNDRQLRNIIGGLHGRTNGIPREDGFDITAASEVMAVFCLSENLTSLRKNLSEIIAAYTHDGRPVTAGDLNAQGAMVVLLKEAFNPNLVQTLENTPALIHGGPFANIAHGCNTITATEMAMRLGDYVVTEAGFGADLGMEKFINIKCRKMGMHPAAVVLVATLRAVRHHGGFSNLQRHLENITRKFGLPCVTAINRFPSDTDAEINKLRESAESMGAEIVLSDVYSRGGEGGLELADAVLRAAEKPALFRYTYRLDEKLIYKIETIAKEIYGAAGVSFTPEASRQIKDLEKLGYGGLPVCMAKTQYSFTDNPKLLGAPDDFIITVRQLRLSAGAGFVAAITGDIMTMPGLPEIPAAENIDIDEKGVINGLF